MACGPCVRYPRAHLAKGCRHRRRSRKPRECFCSIRHEPAFRKPLRTEGMVVGSPRSLAPQQHLREARNNGVNPIGAGVDDMPPFRESPPNPSVTHRTSPSVVANLSLMIVPSGVRGLAHRVFQVPIRIVPWLPLSRIGSRSNVPRTHSSRRYSGNPVTTCSSTRPARCRALAPAVQAARCQSTRKNSQEMHENGYRKCQARG